MVNQSPTVVSQRALPRLPMFLPLAIFLLSAQVVVSAEPDRGLLGKPPATWDTAWGASGNLPAAHAAPMMNLPLPAGLPTRPQPVRPRSAYAPAPRPPVPRRLGAEQLIQSNQNEGREESTRRPPVLSLLEQLAETRGQLQIRLKENANWIGPVTPGSPRPIQEIDSLLQSSRAARRQHADRMNQLLERLEVSIMAQPTDPAGTGSEQAAGATRDVQATSDNEGAAGEQSSSAAPIDAAGRAVDRLRLADSLFGSQKYQLARDIYLELLESPAHADDRVWIEFQIASCYKNLHDTSNAGKYFRLVVGADHDADLAEHARWWLSEMQEVDTVRATLVQLNQAIDEVNKMGHKENDRNSLR